MVQDLKLFFSGNFFERICIMLDDSRFNLSSIITLMFLVLWHTPTHYVSVPIEKLI